MEDDEALRQELNLTLAAREELGSEMEPAVLDAFVERIERRLAQRAGASELAEAHKREHQKEMVLGSMPSRSPCWRSPPPSPGFRVSSQSAWRSP